MVTWKTMVLKYFSHMHKGVGSYKFFSPLYGKPAPSKESQHPEAWPRPASTYGHLRDGDLWIAHPFKKGLKAEIDACKFTKQNFHMRNKVAFYYDLDLHNPKSFFSSSKCTEKNWGGSSQCFSLPSRILKVFIKKSILTAKWYNLWAFYFYAYLII